MAEAASGGPTEGAFDVDDLTSARLRTVRKGFDPLEVKVLLNRSADRIRRLERQVTELRDQLRATPKGGVVLSEVDEATLIAALGEETTRVLRSAREAAAEIVERAEQKATERLKAADAHAREVRERADHLLATESEQAHVKAAEVIDRARTEAVRELEAARAQAERELEEARATGRRMVLEAKSLRKRLLADLAEKRRVATIQIERLRAGRSELLEAFRSVQSTIDSATGEMTQAEAEARSAALRAVEEASPEPDPEERFSELDALEEAAAAEDVSRALEAAARADGGAPVSSATAGDRDVADGVAHEPAGADVGGREGSDRSPAAAGDESPSSGERSAGAGSDGSMDGAADGEKVRRVTPPPVSIAPPDDEETTWRSSALRIIRPRRGHPSEGPAEPTERVAAERTAAEASTSSAGATAVGEPTSLTVVEAPDAIEGVRLVPAPEKSADPVDEPGPSPDPVDEPGSSPDPVPEPAPASHGAPEPESELVSESEPEPESESEGAAAEAADVAPGEVSSQDVPTADEVAPRRDEVGALFKRIRAASADPTPELEPDGDLGSVVTDTDTVTETAAGAAAGAAAVVDGGGDGDDDSEEPPTADAPSAVGTSSEAAAAAGDVSTPDETAEEPASRPRVFAARDAVFDELVHGLSRRLKRTLGDQQNEVLAAARSKKGLPDLERLSPAFDAAVPAFERAARKPLEAAAVAGHSAAGGEVNHVDVDAVVTDLEEAFVASLRRRLARVLDDAATELGDEARKTSDLEVADRVSAVYREWKRERLTPVAEASVRAAFAEGLLDAVPEGAAVRWLVDPERGPCHPDCEDNALAGAVAKGSPFPTGHTRPPAHPGCCCLLERADS